MLANVTHAALLAAETTTTGSQNVWTVLSLVVTAVLAPAILAFVSRFAAKAPQQQEKPDKVVSPEGVEASGMSGDLVKMLSGVWSRLEELENKEKQWDATYEEIIKRSEMLLKTNVAIGTSFSAILDWMDAGANPPSPDVSQEIRLTVQKIVDQAKDDPTLFR